MYYVNCTNQKRYNVAAFNSNKINYLTSMQEKNYVILTSFEKTKYFKKIFHLSQDIPHGKVRTDWFLTNLIRSTRLSHV